ncbi:relaxase/mobilization nuclease domain-containing protein [Parasedimentitalea huanghaiensis]|uniref:Relaxase/mobilization nuclease domain-containing protein n=1 Tax=Parasedimentitalea huanghaiensis TaxID=2682100 RepID=A0A6L6WM74_9RHOB|nr:relaxase/mobilization nuclease domain-containing protein [Zongyanglinia huanghaiensis]MVO18591.1 relaxase/mobilization nuclease domain-containing protein [Zongyanglinia huanghaiensis]
MMVRFFDHGDGSGAAAVEYLLAAEVAAYTEDRKRIPNHTVRREVLPALIAGDPELTRHLIDSNTRKWRYTSGVVAFHADDGPTDRQQAAVMQGFEKAAFAGLEADQANILWVRHQHMGNVELHFLIPRVELYGNRSFNPAPPGSEPYFNAFRDYWNACEGWVSPEEQGRKRMTKPVFDLDDRKQIKEAIQTLVVQKIEAGEIHNHADVRTVLAELDDFEFKPLTEKQLEKRRKADAFETEGGKPRRRDTRITMRIAGTSDSQNTFRLEDRIFHEDWTANEYFAAKPANEGRESIPRNRSADAADVTRLRTAFDASVERRAAKNRARFAKPRRAEQSNPKADSGPDRGSSRENTGHSERSGREPEGMADGHLEDDAADLSSGGLADLLGALDGRATDIPESGNNIASDQSGDLWLGWRESDTWSWRIGAGSEPAPGRRAGRLPSAKPERRDSLHRDSSDEVNHDPSPIDALRDRTLARCRRTEHHLRDWFEECKYLTERLREFEARIRSVRDRVRDTLERFAETARRLEEACRRWLTRSKPTLTRPTHQSRKTRPAIRIGSDPSP